MVLWESKASLSGWLLQASPVHKEQQAATSTKTHQLKRTSVVVELPLGSKDDTPHSRLSSTSDLSCKQALSVGSDATACNKLTACGPTGHSDNNLAKMQHIV